MEGVLEKVKQITVEHLILDENQVTDDASFKKDLGADSVDIVELVMLFEEEFNIKIDDREAGKIHTVGQMAAFIEGQVQGV